MYDLKPLHHEAIPAALEKAKHYRFLGEPEEAESICRDILDLDGRHQEALITLLLALTDKFTHSGISPCYDNARAILEKLDDSYCKYYYLGIIYEKRAKYHLRQQGPGTAEASHGWFIRAMAAYEKAMEDCDPNNDDAVLRWNSCARILNSNPEIQPDDSSETDLLLDPFEMPH